MEKSIQTVLTGKVQQSKLEVDEGWFVSISQLSTSQNEEESEKGTNVDMEKRENSLIFVWLIKLLSISFSNLVLLMS